jgi:hypothetical protein
VPGVAPWQYDLGLSRLRRVREDRFASSCHFVGLKKKHHSSREEREDDQLRRLWD